MADDSDPFAESEQEWWRNRSVAYPVVTVVSLLLVGALSSGLFPNSTFASLVTGMTWSLAWLTTAVVLGTFALSKYQARQA